MFAPESTSIANANYANFAGQVVDATQSNITAVGNLVNLTIADSNVSNPITQFVPTSNVIGTSTFSNNMIRIDNFTDLGNSNSVQSVAFVKSRGNSTTPVAAANNDIIMRLNSYVYNGNTYPKAVMVETLAPSAANANLKLANTAWTAGSFRVFTGNPNGNVANANSNSNQNQLLFNQNGTLVLVQGSPPNVAFAAGFNMINYGVTANSAGIGGIQLTQRARGNRDATSAVQNGDQLGALAWQGYNGNAYFGLRFAQVSANVNTAHGAIANGSSIPTDLNFVTCSNTTSFTTTLSGNGSASFPGNVTTNGNVNVNGNLVVVAPGGGPTTLFLGGDKTTNSSFNMFDAQFSVTMSNVDTTTGFSPFRFQQYAPTSNQFGPMFFYRARGNDFFSSAPVVANDKIMSLAFIVNSNNTTVSVGAFDSTVTYNDNAGNVGMRLDLNATGTGTDGYANGLINLNASITTSNNFIANTVSVGTGSNNITLNGTTGYITYNRTFGSFTSNATQTSAGANTVNYMTLNNTEDSNGVSIVSNSQITIARTGTYDIQFSAELAHDTNQTANVEIWLTKNGNAVANTNTILTLTKDEKAIAAWDWLVNANTANDYFQIAWASSDTNVEIIATDAANTIANVAAPSVIVTVVPVGA